jgi:hypothetical protein
MGGVGHALFGVALHAVSLFAGVDATELLLAQRILQVPGASVPL